VSLQDGMRILRLIAISWIEDTISVMKLSICSVEFKAGGVEISCDKIVLRFVENSFEMVSLERLILRLKIRLL
jgi:hypothetical protein